jgi:hypothetical protein
MQPPPEKLPTAADPITSFTAGSKTVRVAFGFEAAVVGYVLPVDAEIVTGVSFETPSVLISNAATVFPTSSIAFAGMVAAAGLLLESLAHIEPAEAGGPLNVAVPCTAPPPSTLVAFRLMVSNTGGSTV